MPFSRFFERRRRERAAANLYLAVVEQARHPAFYARHGVPDTLEGRYDMILLHAWLLLRRMGAIASDEARPLGQAVFDRMFADMDRNLREMGVSDLRVGKRVQRMAEAFYGRVGAYDKGLAEGAGSLKAALARNLYQSDKVAPGHLDALDAYIKAQIAHLDGLDDSGLLAGEVSFSGVEAAA
jgi:Uncharacterized conserved protein